MVGYSVSPAIYFHFDADIDASRLPAPRLAAGKGDPVFLVDVDPKSPELGRFVPLVHRYYPEALRFVPAHTLAEKPLPGFVLRGGTLYDAVVRRDLGLADNPAPLGTTLELEALKWTEKRPDPVEEAARLLHAEALDRLATLGIGRAEIAAIALFRTQVPEAVTAGMLEVARALPPDHAPRVVSAEWLDRLDEPDAPGAYHTLRGVYCTPNFQSDIDLAPFLEDGGGTVRLDAQGKPRLADIPPGSKYRTTECGGLIRARFVLTLPAGEMPPGGFPLLLSAHGTGGDAYTFLGRNDFAGWAAREGIAVVSTDQPLHGGKDPLGGRPGSREPISISIAGFPLRVGSGTALAELAFYNPLYPGRARDNLRQASVDGMVLARLMAATDFSQGTLLADRPDLVHRRDVRVRHVGHRLRLAQQPRVPEAPGVRAAPLLQHLDRHLAIELLVVRQIHHPHPARAQLPHRREAADAKRPGHRRRPARRHGRRPAVRHQRLVGRQDLPWQRVLPGAGAHRFHRQQRPSSQILRPAPPPFPRAHSCRSAPATSPASHPAR